MKQQTTEAGGAILYRINVAEAKLGVSRSTIYRLVKDGQLDLVKIGKRSSGITADSINAMIERSRKARA
ncbi:AlpA family transcriptional regulator [Herminiimonas sp. CN]|uniref:helix-turn-helix transcriptional regulator n=1 Tax=Herminiimonas sp. CN TaxID=1349818 RepID=UPI0004741DF7|nr:helix-turn-helix domain-containing protein [Herminiimonas sp. CN]